MDIKNKLDEYNNNNIYLKHLLLKKEMYNYIFKLEKENINKYVGVYEYNIFIVMTILKNKKGLRNELFLTIYNNLIKNNIYEISGKDFIYKFGDTLNTLAKNELKEMDFIKIHFL